MLRISAFLLATAALIGCNHGENSPHGPDSHDALPEEGAVGKTLKEFQITDETSVRFHEASGIITLSVEGHVDEMEANADLQKKLFQAKTMESAYRMMDPTGTVPQAILDYDKRPANNPEGAAPAALNSAGLESATPENIPAPLAKVSNHANPAGDANWDWTADANWWKKSVVGYECDWEKAAYYTNVTWADDWRQGWYGTGYLMAASHTYGANAKAYLWQNNAWVQTNSTYLQPRHYIVWRSLDTSKRYRRYGVTGNGGAYARIHWGMRWDTQAPSDVGVICHYD